MDTPSAVPPLPPMIVDRSQPCVKCAYDLRGLPVTGVCPECGLGVQDSLKGIFLQYAGSEYRAKLGRGLSLILNGILIQIVVGVLGFAALMAMGGGQAVVVATSVASLAVTVMLIMGYWFYTEPDPGYTGLEKPNSARQVARVAVIVQAAVQLVQLVLGLMDSTVAPIGGTSAGLTTLMVVNLLLSLTGFAAWAVQFFAVMLYTRWLGSRVPDALIVNRSKTYMWLLPVLTTVGVILVGLGPLIALILYWNLLDRLRKHVKSINASGVPAALPGRG